MAEIGSWNGHAFTVTPQVIRGFSNLSIKSGSETEDQTSDGQKFATRKNSRPSEVSVVVTLNAFAGCNVRQEAMKFIDDARDGAANYFYLGGKKLLTCQLMLIDANVSETEIAPNGTWVSCKVALKMKQCSKYDGVVLPGSSSSGGGGSSGGGSSGSGKSSKKRSTKSTSAKKNADDVVDTVSGAAPSTSGKKTGSLLSHVAQIINNGKKATSSIKKHATNYIKTKKK